jgi:amino acid transporter
MSGRTGPRRPALRRVLGNADLWLMAVASIGPAFSLGTTLGAMVESGGSATPLALVVIAAVMAGIALGYRRLGARYPNAGSSYTWVRAAFGPAAGAYAAWVLIVGNVFATVATAVPAGAYTIALFAPDHPPSAWEDAAVGTGWVLLAGALLLAGLRPTARTAGALVAIELVVLAATAAASLAHPLVPQAAAAAPPPWGGLVGALVIGIWMIDGWEVSASAAEEAATAPSGPGLGGLVGLGISAAILTVCTAAFLRVGTTAGFSEHEGDAMAYVASALGGAGWSRIVTLTVLVSLAASLQATLVYLTRSFFAMGRDGMLPQALGRLDPRAQPATAVVLLTALGAAGTLASGLSSGIRSAFAFILSGTSVFLGLLFVLSAAAAVRLFAGERAGRFDGAVAPGIAALALAGILVAGVARADDGTRLFLLAAAAAGLPLAVWRGRAAAERV